MHRRSIRFRLTVWYAAVLTAGLSLFGGLIWLSMRSHLIGEVDEDLQGRAARFEAYFRAESAEVHGDQLRDELEEFCQALPPGSFISLSGEKGFNFVYYPSGAKLNQHGWRQVHEQFTLDGEVFQLEVEASIRGVDHTLDLLGTLLLSLLPLVIAIACAGGAWLSGRALNPVHDVTAAALKVSIENLSERLPVPGTGDELARLTEVLNGMLARLESAVKTLSQFAADASHELRTPLSVIRTTADLAMRRARPAESYRESLQEISAEAERMTQLIEDLLTLARSDTAAAEMPLSTIDLREVVEQACSEMRRIAGIRGVRIDSTLGDGPATISGNRAALHRLFLLLLDNAVKYSRDGESVVVKIELAGPHTAVTIQDFGVGIAAADLPHIFKRFYRTDHARSGGGHGLGLSLAQSIARLHGGEIQVESTEGSGSKFRVLFASRGVPEPAESVALRGGGEPE